MSEEKITKKDIKELLNIQTKQIEERFVKQEKRIEERLNNQTNVILDAVDEKLENKSDKEITNKILDGQDKIITKLDKLLQEKTTADAQDKRKTKVLEIHNNALKSNKILSPQQSIEIDSLRAF